MPVLVEQEEEEAIIEEVDEDILFEMADSDEEVEVDDEIDFGGFSPVSEIENLK